MVTLTRSFTLLAAASLAAVVAATHHDSVISAQQTPAATQPRPRYSSRIMIYDLNRKAATVVHTADTVWEAPNWSRDGKFLLANSQGKLFRIAVDGSRPPEAIGLDESLRCNNDHDFSPDGRLIAISASSPSSRQSQVYIANADGSNHRLVVSAAPSYFHGWSPDGRYLSFVANRDGTQYDLYRVPAAGGPEERLTSDPANDDGSDYSPDGKWIYFNSERGGTWNIWRIPAAGAGANDEKAERITGDAPEDWFPHPSPDGKSLMFLSFPPGTKGHNDRGLAIQLRMIPMPGDRIERVEPRVITEFSGGQGTINVNSWAPDSRRFAYVTYEVMPS
jgi:TolB protein